MSKQSTGKSWIIFIVPLIVGIWGSNLIFGYFGFNYNIFSDPFNALHLAIDVAVFVVLFLVSQMLCRRLLRQT